MEGLRALQQSPKGVVRVKGGRFFSPGKANACLPFCAAVAGAACGFGFFVGRVVFSGLLLAGFLFVGFGVVFAADCSKYFCAFFVPPNFLPPVLLLFFVLGGLLLVGCSDLPCASIFILWSKIVFCGDFAVAS